MSNSPSAGGLDALRVLANEENAKNVSAREASGAISVLGYLHVKETRQVAAVVVVAASLARPLLLSRYVRLLNRTQQMRVAHANAERRTKDDPRGSRGGKRGKGDALVRT